MKVEGTRYETETWKTIPGQDIAITMLFWRLYPLTSTSMKNSKSIWVYEFNFLNLLQKSIFCHIYNYWIPHIILDKFWLIFFHNSGMRTTFSPKFWKEDISKKKKKKKECLGRLKEFQTKICLRGSYYVSCKKRLLKMKYGFEGSISNFDLGLF